MAEDLQREARALGDPTRHRLFRYIAESAGPVSVAELTQFAQLNHNAVRQHLAVLVGADLVLEAREDRHRPGRPRLLYSLHPEAAGSWGTPGAYAWLANLLSDAVRRKLDPREVGRLEGRRQGVALGGAGEPADLLEAEIARRGFRPVRVEHGRRLDFVLGRCPFAEVASEDAATICELHLGVAEGLSEGIGGLEVERLVAKDARRAGCRLVIRRTAGTSEP